ncbi:hypothetical protein [Haliangium sp.]|uniref:hypothetical protein n=1 Tax=Haliangium sp. TaxID=2663208 RepID=UPI003D150BB6
MKVTHSSLLNSLWAGLLGLTLLGVGPATAWADDDDEEPEAIESMSDDEGEAGWGEGEAGGGEGEAGGGDGEAAPVSGWFRVDTDGLGTQIWFGATHKLGGLDIASDIYLVGTTAELDVGVALSFGDLTLTPMAGVVFDFNPDVLALTSVVAPQLFTIYSTGPIYFESWLQLFLNSPFTDGTQDVFYTRNFVLYQVADSVQVGPQIELAFNLNESADGAGDDGLASLPVGARVNLGYGENNTVGVFLGYETQAADNTDGITGRFTFVRTW